MSARAGRPEASRVGARPRVAAVRRPRSLCDAQDRCATPEISLPHRRCVAGCRAAQAVSTGAARSNAIGGKDSKSAKTKVAFGYSSGYADTLEEQGMVEVRGRRRRRRFPWSRGGFVVPCSPSRAAAPRARDSSAIDTAASPKYDPIRHAPRPSSSRVRASVRRPSLSGDA
jgi:hypothetical protein